MNEFSWPDWRARVKSAVDLRAWGLEHLEGFRGNVALCPFHEESTPSFHVYADHGFCFGCNTRADIFDLIEKVENLERYSAMQAASALAGVPMPEQQTKVRRPRKDNPPVVDVTEDVQGDWIGLLVESGHQALIERRTPLAREAWSYLEKRGLAGLVEIFKFGIVDGGVNLPQVGSYLNSLRGRLIIPYLQDGKPVYFNARDLSGKIDHKFKYLKPKGASTQVPFNADVLDTARQLGWIILTEAELDAATLVAVFGSGYPVVGCSGGTLPKLWLEELATSSVTAYILMDNDDAGRSKSEKLQSILSGLGAKAYTLSLRTSHKDVNDVLQELGVEEVRRLVESSLEEATLNQVSDLGYIREAWLNEVDARANRPHMAYATGLSALDELLDGGYVDGLHLIGGITGGGKTSLALHIALHNALAGKPVIYGSYEQPRFELWARIALKLTGVPYGAIKRGSYHDPVTDSVLPTSQVLKEARGWEQLEVAARNLKIVEGGDAFSRTASTWTVEALASSARDVAEDRGVPPLIIADYLQRIPVPSELKIRDVRERVGYVAGKLQVGIAREIGSPVLALSSVGRACYNAEEFARKPIEERLAAFKEAGELEYTAYTALLIYTLSENLQNRMNLAPGLMSKFKPTTLDLCKNREGKPGRVAAQWYANRGEWTNGERIAEEMA